MPVRTEPDFVQWAVRQRANRSPSLRLLHEAALRGRTPLDRRAPLREAGNAAHRPARPAGADGVSDSDGGDGRPALSASFRKFSLRRDEHTSELQSRLHLVCRLLLEKKKKKNRDILTRSKM